MTKAGYDQEEAFFFAKDLALIHELKSNGSSDAPAAGKPKLELIKGRKPEEKKSASAAGQATGNRQKAA